MSLPVQLTNQKTCSISVILKNYLSSLEKNRKTCSILSQIPHDERYLTGEQDGCRVDYALTTDKGSCRRVLQQQFTLLNKLKGLCQSRFQSPRSLTSGRERTREHVGSGNEIGAMSQISRMHIE